MAKAWLVTLHAHCQQHGQFIGSDLIIAETQRDAIVQGIQTIAREHDSIHVLAVLARLMAPEVLRAAADEVAPAAGDTTGNSQ